MSVLIIDQDQVRRLLSMAECIEIMDKALRTLADEEAIQAAALLDVATG